MRLNFCDVTLSDIIKDTSLQFDFGGINTDPLNIYITGKKNYPGYNGNYAMIFTNISIRGKISPADILFFFWTGLSDPIACSLLGGGSPSQNNSYKITILCPS